MAVYVGYDTDKVALGEALFQAFWISPLITIVQTLHTDILVTYHQF
jgi:hypothetical protein